MIDGFLMSVHSISRAPNCPQVTLFGCLPLSACSRTVRIFTQSALKAVYTVDRLPSTQKLTLGFGSSYMGTCPQTSQIASGYYAEQGFCSLKIRSCLL